MGRPKKVVATDPTVETHVEQKADASTGMSELAQALTQAINASKPKEKLNAANRKRNTPWTPKDGSPQLKLRRKMFHHALPIESKLSNKEIELLNKVKPGIYCDSFVRVIRRKDKGIDIDYPVKTAAQRLKLVNQFGLRDFAELLQRIVDEAENPVQYKPADELD